MSDGAAEYGIEEKVARIEHETGMKVPGFIAELPAINPAAAADLSRREGLIPAWRLERLGDNYKWIEDAHAKAGLRLCRRLKISPLIQPDQLAELLRRPSALELFDRFKAPDIDRMRELARSETRRRELRDNDILAMEIGFLRRRGIEVPHFDTLLQYCEWLPEHMGINEQIRGWGSEIQTARDIYWDLQKHYHQTILQARQSFDPLSDWEQYLKGELDITKYDQWYLQNMGKDDISYYSMSEHWGGGARTRPGTRAYTSALLTHSTSLGQAQDIVAEGYLEPRVCYSSGQLTVPHGNQVVFIFPKDILTSTYSVEPYTEPGGGHEAEMRSNELNSINFAIACVPIVPELFPDQHGSGEGSIAMGQSTIARWEAEFRRSGTLWSSEEEAHIRELASRMSS